MSQTFEKLNKEDLGYYILDLVAEDKVPQSPKFELSLGVYAPSNHVAGRVRISQLVGGGVKVIKVDNLEGEIGPLIGGEYNRILTLEGSYLAFGGDNPDIDSAYIAEFRAQILLREDGTGIGNFSYDGRISVNVPVKPM